MLKINKQSITLTKGDDASLRLVPRYKDKTTYTGQEGDSAIFRLKVGASVKELECVINLENNKIVANFTPDDTKDFEPGIYRYEAELITSLGFHYTFIADQPFILGNEIEQRLSNATSANGNSNGNYPEIDGEIGDEPVVNGDIQPTNPMMDYEELNHLPKLNGKTIKGSHDNAYYGIPTKVSDIENDLNFVSDDDYVHTDNNFSDEYKGVIDNLGTASGYDVPVSGNAGNDEVVLGNDTRLSDARPASDVSSWAKAPNKPTYSASEVGAIPSTDKGSANGVAELDANGKVPSAQLPAYVDDVLEYASVSAFPETGESGKIYIALDTNKTYRWGGSAYAEISESLALGETSSTAYRGDKGKTAYDHATETKLSTATASGLYKVASTAQGHIAGLTPVEKSDITALGIPAQDTTYNDATTSASGLMSANDKTKLNGIANGAQVNVQSDFAQTDTEADDFIKNKPTKVSDFTNDSGFTKVESSTTNGNIKINGTETQVYDDSEIKGELSTDTTTIEGNPLNFTTLSAQTAKSTILSLEPIQDLHGYDKPWVGGAGKNKLPMTVEGIKALNGSGTWSGNVYTYNGVTFTILVDSDDNVIGIKANGQASDRTPLYIQNVINNFDLPNGNYIASKGFTTSSNLGIVIGAYNNTAWVKTLVEGSGSTDNIAFTVDHDGYDRFQAYIVVNNGVNPNNTIYYPMIRLSTVSDASFEPYTNICFISGYDEVDINGCGKNLAELDNVTLVNGSFVNGVFTNTNTDTKSPFNLYVYTYKDNVALYSPVWNINISSSGRKTFTMDLNYDYDYLYIKHNGSTRDIGIKIPMKYKGNVTLSLTFDSCDPTTIGGIVIRDIMINVGSQATPYEPYAESTSLQIQLGETVYGGQLDVENGVLVVDRKIKTITDSTGFSLNATSGRWYAEGLFPDFDISTRGSDKNISNQLKWQDSWAVGVAYFVIGTARGIYINRLTTDETLSDLTTRWTANPIQICYCIEPITINLTPHTINLLKGVNNISVDDANATISLTYRDGSVATLGDLTSAVDNLDSKIDESKILTDTVTGDKYKLVVTSGVLSIEQISN